MNEHGNRAAFFIHTEVVSADQECGAESGWCTEACVATYSVDKQKTEVSRAVNSVHFCEHLNRVTYPLKCLRPAHTIQAQNRHTWEGSLEPPTKEQQGAPKGLQSSLGEKASKLAQEMVSLLPRI